MIVFPGLAVSDFTTLPMRNFLRARGYTPYPWEQGFNFGPRDGVIEGCEALVRNIAERHGRAVSLVGWSLGGVYARELAKAMPECVRCVITLGSPFAGHPRATNAWRLFELVSGKKGARETKSGSLDDVKQGGRILVKGGEANAADSVMIHHGKKKKKKNT